MIFEVTEDVFRAAFEDAERSHVLVTLIRLAGDAPHAIAHEVVETDDAITWRERWLATLGRLRREVEASLRSGTTESTLASPQKTRARIVAGRSDVGARPPTLSLEDGLSVAKRPFSIWVEDNDSDRAFLLLVAGPNLKQRLLKLEGEPCHAVRFEHGGGGVIVRQLQRLSALDALRSWVMVDSDREAPDPDVEPPQKVRDMIAASERLGFRLHVLERREIENYIPLAAMSWWCRNETPYNRQFSEACRSLLVRELERLDDRRFIDMKIALGRQCGEIFADDGPGWRPRWFDDDGSGRELAALRVSLEESI